MRPRIRTPTSNTWYTFCKLTLTRWGLPDPEHPAQPVEVVSRETADPITHEDAERVMPKGHATYEAAGTFRVPTGRGVENLAGGLTPLAQPFDLPRPRIRDLGYSLSPCTLLASAAPNETVAPAVLGSRWVPAKTLTRGGRTRGWIRIPAGACADPSAMHRIEVWDPVDFSRRGSEPEQQVDLFANRAAACSSGESWSSSFHSTGNNSGVLGPSASGAIWGRLGRRLSSESSELQSRTTLSPLRAAGSASATSLRTAHRAADSRNNTSSPAWVVGNKTWIPGSAFSLLLSPTTTLHHQQLGGDEGSRSTISLTWGGRNTGDDDHELAFHLGTPLGNVAPGSSGSDDARRRTRASHDEGKSSISLEPPPWSLYGDRILKDV